MINILYISTGAVLGALLYILSLFLIKRRTAVTEAYKFKFIYLLLFILLLSAGTGLLGYLSSGFIAAAEYIIIFSLCVCIGFIDFKTRKIPNILLLALLISKIVFLIIGSEDGVLFRGLIGFAAGFILFAIPTFFKIPIGSGDIKYASLCGFYLGIYGLLQVMLTMALFLTIFLIYLKISERGNLKTAVAMGPYISLGIMAAVLFPLY